MMAFDAGAKPGPNGGVVSVGTMLVVKLLNTGVSSFAASSGFGAALSGGSDAPGPSVYTLSASGEDARYCMNSHAAFFCLLSANITSWWPPSNEYDLPLGPTGCVVTPQRL